MVTQVLDHSRDFRELLNVMAGLQNILDPDHFKGNSAAMKKVQCDFVQVSDFVGILWGSLFALPWITSTAMPLR